jgi:diacylglycerol kinase
MSVEGLNIAIEKIADFAPEYQHWFIKDIAAGGCFFGYNRFYYRFNYICALYIGAYQTSKIMTKKK